MNDRRHDVSETDSLPSSTIQRQPSLRQQDQWETQVPFVSSTGSPLHHTFSAPPIVSNEPPLWQLGRHSQPSSPTIQRQPSLRHQDQSDTKIPFFSSTGSPLHQTFPPPVVSSEPPLWQLGRHSLYKPSTGHDQKSSTISGQPIFGYSEGDNYGRWDFERVQHQVDKFDESKLIDVEGDLQRGLKARQVRLFFFFLRPCWSIDASHRFQ